MILLDTHAFLWLATEPEALSRPAASAIRRARSGGGIAIATISLWELAQKAAKGRLRQQGPLEIWLRALVAGTEVALRDVTPEIATVAAYLPFQFPADPMDRLIAATARVEGMPLVTADQRIQDSGVVRAIW